MNIELEKVKALLARLEKVWKELEEVKQELTNIAFDMTTESE